MGREIEVSFPIKRIISLVPSQTELLFYLNQESNLVGRTKFCIHPEKQIDNIPVIGGTKKLRIEKIRALNPDLIIGNKEENQKEDIKLLEQEFPVWMSDIQSLEDAFEMISDISAFLNQAETGANLIDDIRKGFDQAGQISNKSVLYLIWAKPYMGVGSGTFIHNIIEKLGLKNILSSSSRYPELSENQIIDLRPELVFLSSEPYPFGNDHLQYFRNLLPDSEVILVNGEFFSWYGSRLLHACEYFRKLKIVLN